MKSSSNISVVIAASESIVLNSIVKKVQNCANYLHIAGTAQTGLEMLSLLKENAADILIADMEIPGMNSLELIQQAKTLYPHLQIIILSENNHFDYVRDAFRIGVKDYLLKPVSQEELSRVLNKLYKNISTEKYDLELEIVSSALNGKEKKTLPFQYFKGTRFLLSLITLGNYPSKYIHPQYPPEFLTYWDKICLQKNLNSYPNLRQFWIIDEICPTQKFVLICADSSQTNAVHINWFLYRLLSSQLDSVPFHIITNKDFISYTDIQNTANNLRQFAATNTTLFSQNHHLFSQEEDIPTWNIKEQRARFDLLYQITTIEQMIKFIEASLKYYIKNNSSQQYIDDFIFECFVALPQLFSFDLGICQKEADTILSFLHTYQTFVELFDAMVNSLEFIIQNSSSKITSDILYKKIRGYIKNNYTQKFTIEEMARHFGYTPAYINRIFKREEGRSPLQYLTVLRVEYAQKLLKKDIKIKTIAASLGYEDAKYFSKIFKQETGMTPSAWIQYNKKS